MEVRGPTERWWLPHGMVPQGSNPSPSLPTRPDREEPACKFMTSPTPLPTYTTQIQRYNVVFLKGEMITSLQEASKIRLSPDSKRMHVNHVYPLKQT